MCCGSLETFGIISTCKPGGKRRETQPRELPSCFEAVRATWVCDANRNDGGVKDGKLVIPGRRFANILPG